MSQWQLVCVHRNDSSDSSNNNVDSGNDCRNNQHNVAHIDCCDLVDDVVPHARSWIAVQRCRRKPHAVRGPVRPLWRQRQVSCNGPAVPGRRDELSAKRSDVDVNNINVNDERNSNSSPNNVVSPGRNVVDKSVHDNDNWSRRGPGDGDKHNVKLSGAIESMVVVLRPEA